MAEQLLAILRRKQVEARTGLSRSGIYQKISEGTFPKSVRLGKRAVGWVEADVFRWIAERIVASRSNAPQRGAKNAKQPATVATVRGRVLRVIL